MIIMVVLSALVTTFDVYPKDVTAMSVMFYKVNSNVSVFSITTIQHIYYLTKLIC
jgi:hypothetical protein